MYTAPLSLRYRLRWLPGLLLAFLLLVACLGGGNEEQFPPPAAPVDVVPPPSGALLACSQECSDRGQCGRSPDRGEVVLLNWEGPALNTNEHDLAVPANTVVEIVEQRSETVVEVMSGLEFQLNFFHVFIPERQDYGWAAGWCVMTNQ